MRALPASLLIFCAALACAIKPSALAKEVEFRFEKPDAQSVELMAEFNNWKAQPMTKQSDGTWTITVSLSPGTYGYKFLVNATEWIFDPKNSNRKTVDGVENSAIEISEQSASAQSSTLAQPPSPTATVAKVISKHTETSPSTAVATTTNTPSAASMAPTPGEILTVEVPLSDKRIVEATKEGNARLRNAKLAIAVPQTFEPGKSWPLIVISNTESYSNIDSMRQFKDATIAEGWVIMAADGVETEKNKEGGDRWPTIAAAFDYMTSAWPSVKDWPIACGGMSGGAKNSAFLAANLARERHRIIGMLMMGCNQDMATVAYRKGPTPANFLTAAVFLSSGKSDTIATPAQHEAVKKSLRATGFQKVRLENFEGAHDIHQPHIGEALRWFTAQSTPVSSTPAKSDFDKFFKKKPPGTP